MNYSSSGEYQMALSIFKDTYNHFGFNPLSCTAIYVWKLKGTVITFLLLYLVYIKRYLGDLFGAAYKTNYVKFISLLYLHDLDK